jgi:hypothetical protein
MFKDLKLQLVEVKEDEYSIPLDISDIISVCQEYSKLGTNIQNQIEQILDCGVEASIKEGIVKSESLPFIKHFLTKITQNAYFGDANSQAKECLYLIDNYQPKKTNLN